MQAWAVHKAENSSNLDKKDRGKAMAQDAGRRADRTLSIARASDRNTASM